MGIDYTRQIYNWLINNNIAEKINTIYEVVPHYCKYILYAVVFFGLLFFAFKFIRFRGVQL